MVDSGNQDVKWGQAASQVNVTDGETDIDFVAFLRANNASAAVTPGDFESTGNFQITTSNDIGQVHRCACLELYIQ
jgi:type 1 fimbria pilin